MTSRQVENIEIWRAAQQIINRYPEEPLLEACQRADAAYTAGDLVNFDLWQRAAQAVKELLRNKAEKGTTQN
jgi:hypothetical protein